MKDKLVDKAALIAFVCSISLLFMGYGFFVHRSHIFPYEILLEAKLAYKAFARIWSEGRRPAGYKQYVATAVTGPRVTNYAREGRGTDDWILVAGGPYQFMQECPEYGCLAWVVDRDGRVVHSWETDLEELWRDVDHVKGSITPEGFKVLGVQLLPDGGLLAAYHTNRAYPEGGGLARFDRDGELVWFNDLNIHHWFTLDDEGTIYAAGHDVVKTPIAIGDSRNTLDCPKRRAQVDYVAVISAEGELLSRIGMTDLLLSNGYMGLIRTTMSHCDPYHLNFVQHIDAATAASVPGADAGDLLVSLRNINTVLIFSPLTRTVKWLSAGRYVRQHSPRFMPDGSIVVFDNMGGDRARGGSRVVRQWVDDDRLTVVVPRDDAPREQDFFTHYGGHISVSDDGESMLVSLTSTGAIHEIDVATGRTLWRYDKVFPLDGVPGTDADQGKAIRTEAFGAYYVDKAAFGEVFGP